MRLSTSEFNQLMQTIADGWNEERPESRRLLSEDAIYVEPPRDRFTTPDLYEFFGGDSALTSP
jgi:hypothetical protein